MTKKTPAVFHADGVDFYLMPMERDEPAGKDESAETPPEEQDSEGDIEARSA